MALILTHEFPAGAKSIFAALKPLPRLVDVGCGIRPCLLPCEAHICIEPHGEYVEHLRAWWPDDRTVCVWRGEVEALSAVPRDGTTVLLLDVIEHLERERGEHIRDLCAEFEQAVIFTPNGWKPQSGDNPDKWGLNGGDWQKHRSAWVPEDFEGWTVHEWRTSILAVKAHDFRCDAVLAAP